VADAAVEFDAAFFHRGEDLVVADQGRAGSAGGGRGGGRRVADYGDAQVGLYWVWESEAVAHYGAVLECA